MIRNILLDMGGVVFIQDTAEAERRFAAMGIDTSRYMGAYAQHGFFGDLEAGRIGEAAFCREMARATGREQVTPDQARHCWEGFIKAVPAERLAWIDALRAEGYRLGLLSNTNPFVMSRMNDARTQIASHFDHLMLSYRLGVCKPSREIYEKALSDAGMLASETIFVDDGPHNISGAEAIGIHGLHITTNTPWLEPLRRRLEAGR